MKKVLITGIDSFTGKHLSTYLEERGYDVYGTSTSKNKNNIFKCDITIKDEISIVLNKVKPNYLIHLAGISFAAHGNNEDFYKVNTIGTINILDILLELKLNPKKIILASSATVYGNQGLEVLDESLCPKPVNHYGASKYAMETMASNYFTKLNIIITRPFNYTGIGQAEHFLIPKIIKHYKEKKDVIELGNIDVSREFNDIKYISEIYENLLNTDINGEVVNVSSNKAIKLLDIINILNKIAGYEIDIKVNPLFVRKDEIKRLTGSTIKLFTLIDNVEVKDIEITLGEMFEA